MRNLSVAILSVVSALSAASSASALAYSTGLDPVSLIAHPLTSRDSCAATYDYVFGSKGKGGDDVVLSHSCLPDPCDDANAPALARLLDIDIRPSDWEFYKARFGAMCALENPEVVARAESLPFGVAPLLGEGGPLLTPGNLLPAPNPVLTAATTPPSTPTTVASGTPPTPSQPGIIPTPPTPFPWGNPTTPTGGGGNGGGGGGGNGGGGNGGGGNGGGGNANDGLNPPPAEVVPLPGGSVLLISALAVVGVARRRKS